MAAEAWLRRWGWGQRCPGRPGLPGPGPGPATFLHFLLLLVPVAADITDGNSEHLKREHSLIKPYQGEACSKRKSRVRMRDWSGLSMSVSAHRGRFQFHAALGLPRQHNADEPVRASDP